MENSLKLYTPTKLTDSWCSVCHDAEVPRRVTLYCANQGPICHDCYEKIWRQRPQAPATETLKSQSHHRFAMENCLELPPPRQIIDGDTWCSLCCEAEVPHRATLDCPKYGPLCSRCYQNILELSEECN
ncbi:uncharacterized protein LOC135142369 [Zophobas morio]|uniref:uncharacterized protein LOC135142369 n=1 Tax=Zophobas morio TaxID=2755281 RepID=UPI003083B431